MTQVWTHEGCGTYWGQKLTSCPRHPGEKLKETTMPKITRYGGASNSSISDTATGTTERDSGLTEDTDRIRNQAAERTGEPARASDDFTGQGYVNDNSTTAEGQPSYLGDDGKPSGLVAGGDDAPAKGEPPFDPSELSVADAQALLAECSDEEKAAVIAAEKAGKNRKGIVGGD